MSYNALRMTVTVPAPSRQALDVLQRFNDELGSWERVLYDLFDGFEVLEPERRNVRIFLLRRTVRQDGMYAIGRRELLDNGFRIYWYQDREQKTDFLEFTRLDDGKIRFLSTVKDRPFDASRELPEVILNTFDLAFEYLIAS